MNRESSEKTKEGKYLTFQLGNEQYGLGILNVKEIIGMMPVTCLPKAPAYMLGVINLRGKVIPVVDLRRKFGMVVRTATERTCIIVVEKKEHGVRGREVGIVVDAVSEVLHVKAENIEEAPQLGDQFQGQAILGIAKEESGVKILLDIDNALTDSENMLMGQAA